MVKRGLIIQEGDYAGSYRTENIKVLETETRAGGLESRGGGPNITVREMLDQNSWASRD